MKKLTELEKDEILSNILNEERICPYCREGIAHEENWSFEKNICIIDFKCLNCSNEWSENFDNLNIFKNGKL